MRVKICFLVVACILSYSAHASGIENIQLQFRHYSIFDGLSNSTVRCIHQDKNGLIWIGTGEGLNLFNGYTFKVYKNNSNDSLSLGNNNVWNFSEDAENNIWIGTDASLDRYNKNTNSFTHYYINKNAEGNFELSHTNIDNVVFMSSYIDSRNIMWFCFGKGLFAWDLNTDSLINYRSADKTPFSLISEKINTIYEDSNNNLWLGTAYHGVYKIDESLNHIHHYKKPINVQAIFESTGGKIWIGTLGEGLFHIEDNQLKTYELNAKNQSVLVNETIFDITEFSGDLLLATQHGIVELNPITNNMREYNEVSLENTIKEIGTVNCFFKDSHQNIWVGTFRNSLFLVPSTQKPFNKLLFNSKKTISALCYTSKGNLLVGSDGGGLDVYNKSLELTHHFSTESKIQLSSNKIVALYEDVDRRIWIGTYFGGVNILPSLSENAYYINDQASNYGYIPHTDVRDFCEDNEQNIYIATHNGGAAVYNKQSGKAMPIVIPETPEYNFSLSCLYSLCSDGKDNIWMGSIEGVFKYNTLTDSMYYMKMGSKNASGLTSNVFYYIFKDENNTMWFGTSNGLHKLVSDSTNFFEFKSYSAQYGLRNAVINSIINDDSGNLWMGTNNGISRFNPTAETFKNYDYTDGLSDKEFSAGSVSRSESGTLFFGGPLGVTYFNANTITDDTIKPITLITDFKLFNQSVKPNQEINGRKLLKTSITETNEITLMHSENVFTFEFVGLHFLSPDNNKYKYMLEGFNDNWIETDAKNRTATYTNIDAGEYVFKVLAANSDGIWADKEAKITLTILPPFWRTKTAIVLYVFLIAAFLALFRYYTRKSLKLENELRLQKLKAEQDYEIAETKMRFFTNISHEFRTPLTLILGPIAKILKNNKNKDSNFDQFVIIKRNADRLMRLINQILDFRKLEAGKLNIEPKEGNIVSFTQKLISSFKDYNTDLGVKIKFKAASPEIKVWFDHEKLEAVIINLISNALKYSKKNGTVSINIAHENNTVTLSISDTGVGIPEEQVDKIFDRFFKASNKPEADIVGSGIGLSFVKDIITLHEGEIKASSKLNHGTTITINLPVKRESDNLSSEPAKPITGEPATHYQSDKSATQSPIKVNSTRILVVEDNLDLRKYLREELSNEYKVYDARNGKIGLEKAIKYNPSLVLSDIMMPEMNGFELCQQLKTHEKTSHIPVILLTSITENANKIQGFEFGADDYIDKPFDLDLLKARIKSIIDNRHKVSERFKKGFDINVELIASNKEEESLLKKATDIIEQNIANTDFSPDVLAKELAMSRTKLYNTLGELSGYPVSEFIKSVRLKKAAWLLTNESLSISDVAFQVGFKDLAHFSRSFQKFFNVTPTKYRVNHN